MKNNTSLWDKVCKTDPAHTKSFNNGKFSGTAIKPYWLVKQATDIFGLCGQAWGWDEIEHTYVAGVWCSKVKLWYHFDDKRGEITQWGQTFMERTTADGKLSIDEEAPKKAITDGVVKCLSYLGFGADVHMGLFDDSKYVSEVAKDFVKVDSPFKTSAARKEYTRLTVASIMESENNDAIDKIMKLNLPKIKAMMASGNEHDELAVDEIRKQVELRRNDFAEQEMNQQFKDATQ